MANAATKCAALHQQWKVGQCTVGAASRASEATTSVSADMSARTVISWRCQRSGKMYVAGSGGDRRREGLYTFSLGIGRNQCCRGSAKRCVAHSRSPEYTSRRGRTQSARLYDVHPRPVPEICESPVFGVCRPFAACATGSPCLSATTCPPSSLVMGLCDSPRRSLVMTWCIASYPLPDEIRIVFQMRRI